MVEDEVRGRFVGFSGGVGFSLDVRGRFFDLEAVGLYGKNCVIIEQRTVEVLEKAGICELSLI